MPHIQLPEGAPGIVGPMIAYPETEKHLNGLAEELLRGPSALTPAEREMIAAYVSCGNECYFCTNAHAATARHLLGEDRGVVDEILDGTNLKPRPTEQTPVSAKMKALLNIADKVRRDGRLVTEEDVVAARAEGADDKTIHDTVLIAAAFCMFNRYVDGLATFTPHDTGVYEQTGEMLATKGYVTSIR